MHLVIVGGSDAGIAAALRARELDPAGDVTVLVADAYPNYSICGLPYLLSGDVPNPDDLAHTNRDELERTGMTLLLDHLVKRPAELLGRQPEAHAILPASGAVIRAPSHALFDEPGALEHSLRGFVEAVHLGLEPCRPRGANRRAASSRTAGCGRARSARGDRLGGRAAARRSAAEPARQLVERARQHVVVRRDQPAQRDATCRDSASGSGRLSCGNTTSAAEAGPTSG